VIRRGGLEVFPRLVAAEHRIPLRGGLGRGTSTLVMGPAGASKTLLASHFVHHAAVRGDRAALFDSPQGMLGNMLTPVDVSYLADAVGFRGIVTGVPHYDNGRQRSRGGGAGEQARWPPPSRRASASSSSPRKCSSPAFPPRLRRHSGHSLPGQMLRPPLAGC